MCAVLQMVTTSLCCISQLGVPTLPSLSSLPSLLSLPSLPFPSLGLPSIESLRPSVAAPDCPASVDCTAVGGLLAPNLLYSHCCLGRASDRGAPGEPGSAAGCGAGHSSTWQAALLDRQGVFLGCSAVLLSCSPAILAAAAHCLADRNTRLKIPVEELQLIFGIEGVTGGTEEVSLQVEEVIIHPAFKWFSIAAGRSFGGDIGIKLWENDIAIIRVKEEEIFCSPGLVWPACLPNKEADYTDAVLAGWREEEGLINQTLVVERARLAVVTDKLCQESFLSETSGYWQIHKTQMCGVTTVTANCTTDTGAVVVGKQVSTGGYSVLGLASYTITPCSPGTNQTTAFTQIAPYLAWIAEQQHLSTEAQ